MMLNTCLSKTGQFCPPGTVLPRCLTKTVTILLLQPDDPSKEFCFKFVVDDTYEGNCECGFYETFNCKQSDLAELPSSRYKWRRSEFSLHMTFYTKVR